MWQPALATQPVPITCTFGRMNRTMSWMVSPDSTWPPGELMIIRIGSLFSSASANSWAEMLSATFWLISPNRRMVRALNRFSDTLAIAPAGFSLSGFSGSSPREGCITIWDLSFELGVRRRERRNSCRGA